MAGLLTDFLREAATAPHRWGEWDCCMALANWVRARTGSDPAAHLRGAYADEAGWRRLVDEAGGMVSLVDGMAVKAGLRRGEAAAPGDLAVIDVAGLTAGAIRVERGFALKLDRGLTRVRAVPAIAGWVF